MRQSNQGIEQNARRYTDLNGHARLLMPNTLCGMVQSASGGVFEVPYVAGIVAGGFLLVCFALAAVFGGWMTWAAVRSARYYAAGDGAESAPKPRVGESKKDSAVGVIMFGLVAIVFAGLLVSVAHSMYVDLSTPSEQAIEKVSQGVAAGAFDTEGVRALSLWLDRENDRVKANPAVVRTLVVTAASLLTDDGTWVDEDEARKVYELAKRLDERMVVDELAAALAEPGAADPQRIVIVAVKLGIPGTEDRLLEVLSEKGSRQMAEDFLNSGSAELAEGATAWAEARGYWIKQGEGSHRAGWGTF